MNFLCSNTGVTSLSLFGAALAALGIIGSDDMGAAQPLEPGNSFVGQCTENQVTEASGQCYHQSRRHGCSYYNFDCSPTVDQAWCIAQATAGNTPPEEPCNSASCQQSLKTHVCSKKCIKGYQNTCEYTGGFNTNKCDPGQGRCTLRVKIPYNHTDGSGAYTQPFTLVWLERLIAGSYQCDDDILKGRANNPKCSSL